MKKSKEEAKQGREMDIAVAVKFMGEPAQKYQPTTMMKVQIDPPEYSMDIEEAEEVYLKLRQEGFPLPKYGQDEKGNNQVDFGSLGIWSDTDGFPRLAYLICLWALKQTEEHTK